MDKRYQVFISSTFADLKDERDRVARTLMQMDCIPAGMELFPAIDEEQWQFIKKVIDDCDYYLVIIGGRYGTVTNEGVSYTEKEYEYAKSIGLKVTAFIHKDPGKIAAEKSEGDPVLREKLERFKDTLKEGRLVNFWTNAEELPGLVALSLPRTIKVYPAVGWIRGSSAATAEVLNELNDLRKENEKLKSQLAANLVNPPLSPFDLVDIDEQFEIRVYYYAQGGQHKKKGNASWAEIFVFIGPSVEKEQRDSAVNGLLAGLLKRRLGGDIGINWYVEKECMDVIRLQLVELGLVVVKVGATDLEWQLSVRGRQFLRERLLVKKAPKGDHE